VVLKIPQTEDDTLMFKVDFVAFDLRLHGSI